MDGLLKAICIIAGIYAFMALMMFFYQEIYTLLLNGRDSNYLIRVNVQNTYSFNTNLIGYLKYMTLKSNTLSTLGNSIIYALASILNLLWLVFMFARMLMVGIIIIIAPITAVSAMLENATGKGSNIGSHFKLKNWAITYLKWLWTPIIVGAIVYPFILYIG